MPDDDKAFDFAQTVIIQLLTLSTGIITVTLAFFQDFAPHASSNARRFLLYSWIAYAGSIGFGILGLLALTGTLGASKKPTTDSRGIYGANIRIPTGLQIVTFFVGLVLTVIGGGLAIRA